MAEYRGLSLTQPWATLVAIGAKQFETRGWTTDYRGPILIHASARFPSACIALCYEEPFYSCLKAAGYNRLSDLPVGGVIAKANLVEVMPTRVASFISAQERSFGDYGPRRYAFKLEDIQRTPFVPWKGALSLWPVPPELLASLGETPHGPSGLPLFDDEFLAGLNVALAEPEGR